MEISDENREFLDWCGHELGEAIKSIGMTLRLHFGEDYHEICWHVGYSEKSKRHWTFACGANADHQLHRAETTRDKLQEWMKTEKALGDVHLANVNSVFLDIEGIE